MEIIQGTGFFTCGVNIFCKFNDCNLKIMLTKSYFLKGIAFLTLSLLMICSCKQVNKSVSEQENSTAPTEVPATKNTAYSGNYVDDSYDKKNEGYDWVAVIVNRIDDNSISISVRSRADKKRPTCTFDTKAYKKNEGAFEAVYDGKNIEFHFLNDSLTIAPEHPEEGRVLSFFCSGGASFAGTYRKIDDELDKEQLDPTTFSKVLNLQGVGFNVSSVEKEGEKTLSIFTFGLQEQEYNESQKITGEKVTNAEVEDLNKDGSPELLVYTQSEESNSYGNVYAFSINNMKSMSQVYFPPVSENSRINKGYKGHDEFSIVENNLVQRFPIYSAEDSSETRQIFYKLVEGETMRRFEVDSVTDY